MDSDYFAIATGDIVGSTNLDEEERYRLRKVLRKGYAELQESHQSSVPFNIDIFRGDSWQILIKRPDRALEICLLFRTFLLAQEDIQKLDTRISIGVGRINLHSSNISENNGEAYRLSGMGLDRMKKSDRLAMLFPATKWDDDPNLPVDAILMLMDTIIVSWTKKQARAVHGSLEGRTQKRIAEEWTGGSISQQAVAAHLDKAGWDGIKKGIDAVANLTNHIISRLQ
jgi:hypothetical protein